MVLDYPTGTSWRLLGDAASAHSVCLTECKKDQK